MNEWSPPTRWGYSQASHLRSTKPTTNDIALQYGAEPPILRAFYAKIDPGGFIIPHIDASPWHERWHYPIQTGGHFWQDGVHFSPTEPFIVKHWLPHAVYNNSDKPRVHLIVDRDIELTPRPATGLVLTKMIPEVQALIDRSHE